MPAGGLATLFCVRRLVVTVLALAVPFAATAAAGEESTRSVYHVGDSLAYGTSLYLEGFLDGWSVREEVAVSMQSTDVPRRVRSAGARLPHVVVVSAGTNGSPSAVARFSADVRATVAAAGPGRCVIWATVVRPPYHGVSYAALNRALRSLDSRYAEPAPARLGSDGAGPPVVGVEGRRPREHRGVSGARPCDRSARQALSLVEERRISASGRCSRGGRSRT